MSFRNPGTRHCGTKRSILLGSALLLLSLGPLFASADPPEIAAGATEYSVEMRDGVKLATNVFLPEGEGPWPVVLTRTPYGKDQGMFPQMVPRYTGNGYGERPDYLRFMTEPLEQDLAVAGRLQAELWVETDAPDTDFMVKLVDVYPDGYEALLLDAPLRARYRKGRNPDDVAMMRPGEPQLLEVDLWSTANIFEQGHRLALHVTSSNYPRFEVNPNNGNAPGDEGSTPHVATNALHFDADHPTALIVPVLVP